MCVGFCSCVISKKDIVQAKNVDLLKMLLRRPFQRPKKKKEKRNTVRRMCSQLSSAVACNHLVR